MSVWFAVIRALADFVFKAVVVYAGTAEGEKELEDITQAWENAVNNEGNEGSVSYSAEARAIDEILDEELASIRKGKAGKYA